MHGIEPREGAELRKRASVFQRSSQGAQAPRRSVRAARGRDSLPRHLELTRTSAKGSFSFMWTMHGIEPREGAELRKRASVFQRSSQGAQAPRRSVRAARGRDSLPRHLELTRTSAKGSFSFMWTRGKRIPLLSERMECAFRRLPSACMRISVRHLDPARPRHSSRFCATLQTVRSSVRTRGYTQNDTFPMQYDAGLACTIRRGQ